MITSSSPFLSRNNSMTFDVNRIYSNVISTEYTIIDDQVAKSLLKLSTFIGRYGFLIIVPIGLIGNMLSMLVMLMKPNRTLPCNSYILFLAVFDNAALLGKILLVTCRNYGFWDSAYICGICGFIIETGWMTSAFLIVCLTIDRFIAVSNPIKAITMLTKRRVTFTTLGIITMSVSAKLIVIFTSLIYPNGSCGPIPATTILGLFLKLFHIAVNAFIPFVAMLIFNIGIILKLRLNRAELDHFNQESRKSNEQQLVKILPAITAAFFIFAVPLWMWSFTYHFIDYTTTPLRLAVFDLTYQITALLNYTNSSINFIFYLVAGKKFRGEFIRIIKCKYE